MRLTPIKPFPPGANPYRHDVYNMGETIGKDLEMMYGNQPDEPCHYLIFVNTKTGERFRLDIDERERPLWLILVINGGILLALIWALLK